MLLSFYTLFKTTGNNNLLINWYKLSACVCVLNENTFLGSDRIPSIYLLNPVLSLLGSRDRILINQLFIVQYLLVVCYLFSDHNNDKLVFCSQWEMFLWSQTLTGHGKWSPLLIPVLLRPPPHPTQTPFLSTVALCLPITGDYLIINTVGYY